MKVYLSAVSALALAACGAAQDSDDTATTNGAGPVAAQDIAALFGLDGAEDRRVSFASSDQDGDTLTFSDVTFDAAGESISADSLALVGADAETGGFEKLTVSGVEFSAEDGDDQGTVNVGDITIENPSEALAGVVAGLLAGDDPEAVFESFNLADVTFDAISIGDVAANFTAEGNTGAIVVEGVEFKDFTDDVFGAVSLSGASVNLDTEDGPVTMALDTIELLGTNRAMLQATIDNVEATVSGASPEEMQELLAQSPFFNNVYEKQFDSAAIRGLSVNALGVEVDLEELARTANQTRGGLRIRETMSGLTIGANDEYEVGSTMALYLAMLGYDKLSFSSQTEVLANPVDDTIRTNGATFTMEDGFSLGFDFEMSGAQAMANALLASAEADLSVEPQTETEDDGITLSAGMDTDAFGPEALKPVTLSNLTLTLDDKGLANRAWEVAAVQFGMESGEDLKAMAVGFMFMASAQLPPMPESARGLVDQALDAGRTFVQSPGTLTITLDPEAPVSLGDVLANQVTASEAGEDMAFLDQLLTELNISISAEPGETPAPTVSEEASDDAGLAIEE